MKTANKMIALGVACCVGFTGSMANTKAAEENPFEYKKGDQLYQQSQIIQGKKHVTIGSKKKTGTQYQIVRMTEKSMVLRPQKGSWMSDDPYFANKTVRLRISANCKFYYRNVLYSYTESSGAKYKKIAKSEIKNCIKNDKISYEYVEEANGKCYTGGYFGEIYTKNGEIAAVLTDGGD